MYDATWCSICKTAKKHFKTQQIPYVSYDVENNRLGRMGFKLFKGKSVPILIVGKKRMYSFTVAKFDKLYEDKILSREVMKQELN